MTGNSSQAVLKRGDFMSNLASQPRFVPEPAKKSVPRPIRRFTASNAPMRRPVWESRLTEAERQRLRPRLAPFLGYLDTILFGDAPKLDPARRPAEKAWPVARQMCEADRRRQRNVLQAAADRPQLAKADADFQVHLLNPTLQRSDAAAVAATVSSPTLAFAVSLLESHPKPYPRAETQDHIDGAKLWLEILPQKPRTVLPVAPTLDTLQQYPIAVLYRHHVRGQVHVAPSFWCQWVRVVATPDVREVYYSYVCRAGVQDSDFFRFAAGWNAVVATAKKLRETEEDYILRNPELFESYLAAVLEGAPLTPEVSGAVRREHVRTVCTTPEAARALFDKRLKIDGLLPVRIWHICLERMQAASRAALTSELTRGRMGKLLQWVLKPREVGDPWYHVAAAIYAESSPESQKHIMESLTGDGTPSATIQHPNKWGK